MTPRKINNKARRILKTKVVLFNGVIVEMKIWQVPVNDRFPEGYKYSLFAVFGGRVLVGYDNHHPKGHHRHIGGVEYPYHFTSLEALKNDFRADLESEMNRGGL